MASKNGKPDKTLTQRQEEFSMAVVQGASLSEAYRQSHNHPNMKAKTVWEKASRLRAMDKVLARIEELREVGKERVEYDHTQWLQEIQRCAFFDPRKLFDSHGNPIDIAELPDDVAPAIAGFEIEEVFIGKKEEGRIPAAPDRLPARRALAHFTVCPQVTPQQRHERLTWTGPTLPAGREGPPGRGRPCPPCSCGPAGVLPNFLWRPSRSRGRGRRFQTSHPVLRFERHVGHNRLSKFNLSGAGAYLMLIGHLPAAHGTPNINAVARVERAGRRLHNASPASTLPTGAQVIRTTTVLSSR